MRDPEYDGYVPWPFALVVGRDHARNRGRPRLPEPPMISDAAHPDILTCEQTKGR